VPVPVGVLPPTVADYLQSLEDRLLALEVPGSPTPLLPMASTSLTATNAATYRNCQVFVTDLLVIGYSSGVHWYRTDTGGVIV
jgi:hypothetical protein